MRKLLAALLCLPCIGLAQTVAYVATTGSDANNCLSVETACATPMRGAAAAGNRGAVIIAPGSYYSVQINVMHSDYIAFTGNCSNHSSVVLYTIPLGVAAYVQDHATATFNCIKFATVGSGSVAIAARQFAIVDYGDVVFGHFPLGRHVSIGEMSKANCSGSIGITGDASTHLEVSGISSVSLNCVMTFVGTPTLGYVVTAQAYSFISMSAASFSGSVTVTNNSYAIDASILAKGSVTIPGPAGTNSRGLVQ